MVIKMDGRETSRLMEAEILGRMDKFARPPMLAAILVGDNPASHIYVRNKRRKAAMLGISFELAVMPASASEEEILSKVGELNSRIEVNGILVQMPLPKHVDARKVIEAISPIKDVDGFSPINQGKLAYGDEKGLVPCTPLGITRLLEHYNVPIRGARAVVIGRSNIVGRPMALMLLNRGATVTICHSQTIDLASVTREADILVSAAGKAGLVTADMARDGAAVVDVAMNRSAEGKLVGDTDLQDIQEKAGFYTPIPGGVGPMTIISLMQNVIKACEIQNGEIQI